jgi:hypothetical protein
MERKMSQRNSIRLPEDFLKGLGGLDDSFLNGNDSVNSMDNSSARRGMDDSSRRSQQQPSHREFSEAEISEMSKAALQLSDSESELSVDLDEEIDEVI